MKTFAKIFTIGKRQVLIEKGYDSEEDNYTITQTTYSKSEACAKMTASWKEEKECNLAFDKYGEEQAKNYQKTVDKLSKP